MSRIASFGLALLFWVTQAQGQIPSTFFGMGISTTVDMPKVSYGLVSHPPNAWTAIEGKGRGVYTFGSTDNFVKTAPKDANGVAQVDIVFGWTPGWAVANQSTCFHNKTAVIACTAPPDSIQDWVDFITAVANHYNGKTAPHVKYYEIWNEMSNTLMWTGTAAQMMALAQAAYPILKSDPYSQVLTPSVVWQSGRAFMANYLQAGGSNYADGVTFHGYSSQTGPRTPKPVPLPESPLSTNAPIVTMVTTFRSIADTNNMQGKPLLTTEGGWGSNGVTDPDMQIAWITHFEILQAGVAAANNLITQTWYEWGKVVSGTIENSSGMPTPAGNAYNVVYGWLVGQSPAPCTNSGNIYSCQVGANLIVWDTSQTCSKGVCTTSPFTPPLGYSQYVDVTNASTVITGSINLGVKPLMLGP